jgi:hypothetical protein
MRLEKALLLVVVALLVGGMVIPEDAFARGGRGGGGRGGRGGGRGKYKDKGGKEIDRPALIEMAETDMRAADRDQRFQASRAADFEAVLAMKRGEVFARHRRQGENSRNQQDSRLEVPR